MVVGSDGASRILRLLPRSVMVGIARSGVYVNVITESADAYDASFDVESMLPIKEKGSGSDSPTSMGVNIEQQWDDLLEALSKDKDLFIGAFQQSKIKIIDFSLSDATKVSVQARLEYLTPDTLILTVDKPMRGRFTKLLQGMFARTQTF